MIVDIDLGSVTILVIDDSRYARSFIKSALQSFGARSILDAPDGPTGIHILAERKVDLVLVDHDMEPMNGVEFTRFLRSGELPDCRDLPVVMISGLAEMETVIEARNAGVTEFLAKPVSAESLFRRVRNALVNPRPFVTTELYVGPCRRTIDRPPPDGINRRKAAPLPKPPPLIQVPPTAAQPIVRRAVAAAKAPPPAGQAPARTSRKRFKAGTVIFREGDIGHEAYVVEAGLVNIYKTTGSTRVVLGQLGIQGIFGEMALIDDEPRMATAEAAEDTVCLVIPKDALKAQIGRTPDMVILVLETLLQNIRKMGSELVDMRARLKAKRGF